MNNAINEKALLWIETDAKWGVYLRGKEIRNCYRAGYKAVGEVLRYCCFELHLVDLKIEESFCLWRSRSAQQNNP